MPLFERDSRDTDKKGEKTKKHMKCNKDSRTGSNRGHWGYAYIGCVLTSRPPDTLVFTLVFIKCSKEYFAYKTSR